MTINRKLLKNGLGIFFITTHMGIILWVIMEYIFFENITPRVCESVFIAMGPLFATYTGMIMRDFFADPLASDSRKIHISRAFIAFLIPIVAFLSIGIILFVQRSGARFTAEDIGKILGIIEGVLGLYLGIIMRSLFDEVHAGNNGMENS